ncbi:MAG: hypothetical protein KC431_01405, partial [Myxococcales bacterium]|nr:hypothetical protein [Myxococcales bacterium]
DPALQAALSPEQQQRLAAAEGFLGELVDYWAPYYTQVAGVGGYFWYSDLPADAIAVHNTSALVAMAWWHYGQLIDDPSYGAQAKECADFLRARVSTTAAGGWAWHYADEGYPKALVWEDISHALVTNQFIAFAGARGWWSPADLGKQGLTLLAQMWSDHPARLHGRVDGSSGGATEWTWTKAAVIGYAAAADASGGQPASFDFARSILLSSYLSAHDVDVQGTTAAVQTLALARLFEHRPSSYDPDSTWLQVAGPEDDAIPQRPGGVRFYTVDWSAPGEVDFAGLAQPARTATAANANLLVDLESGESRPVVVSLTYAAAVDGVIGQWDGDSYLPLAALPASQTEDGVVRWMRTSFLLDSDRFDYQGAVVGDNVLLQISSLASVSRIEATILD